MQSPIVHSGGSSRQALIDSYWRPLTAINAAIHCLRESYPNERDYYPLGDGAFSRAVAEHADRIRRLGAVSVELEALTMDCYEQ